VVLWLDGLDDDFLLLRQGLGGRLVAVFASDFAGHDDLPFFLPGGFFNR